MRKKSYHHANLKKALFLSCHRQLKKTDPELISLRGLAEEIGISHAAIYRHFQDKETLIEQMATYGFQRLVVSQKRAYKKGKNPEEGFLEVGLAYIHFAIRNPHYYKIMFLSKRKMHSPELTRAMLRSYSIIIFACRSYLQSKSKTNNPRIYALMAWSLVHGYSNLYLETSFPQAEAQVFRQTHREFVEKVLRNIL